MSKKIVVVTGSPRENGNTEILADAFIKGAKEGGSVVTKFNVGKMNIKPCVDCKYCFTNDGECCQEDEMQEIYTALREADMLVFASPVYWFGLSAQLKAMIDRLYVAATKEFPITETALLTVYADTDTEVVKPTIAHYKAFTNYIGWQDKGIITQEGVEEKGDIEGLTSLDRAYELGKQVS